MFMSIMVIRINFKPYKHNHLTTRHSRVMKAQQVEIVHDDYQRIRPGPPYPSAHLPRDTLTGIRGWLMHYSFYILEV
jgi:hypothetical protein